MAENTGEPKMTPTLGLTGLTMNAMALIAPGAFLWLTFFSQAGEGATAPSMWIGILFATLLCLATAVSYAEMAKLYPGTGSSYYFAEQSFLNHDKAWKYARLMKFIVGWGSHLYYWIYPGVMVAVTGVFTGYIVGTLWPNFMSAANPGPMFMMAVAIVFSFGVAYIAHRGVTGSTAVSVAINVIQISALIVFSVMAIGYRINHAPGSVARQWDSTTNASFDCEFATTSQMVAGTATDVITRDANQAPVCKVDASGKPVPFHVDYTMNDASGNFLAHPNAKSVIAIHNFNWMFVQATVAILILVGFESVTSLGGEAKNAKRDVPIAVITSLLVQGAFCYLFEYFAANYFLNSGYPMATATGSSAPIGDMMVMVGDALFGSGHGRTFMLIEAVTVFLALIGTTLSCMNTGARVTYAMGRDAEVPEHFGLLHGENLTPHRAIWTLATISAVLGAYAALYFFAGSAAPDDKTIATLPHNLWYAIGMNNNASLSALPNGLALITLLSNFGTFVVYGLTNVCCIVAYREHHMFHGFKHMAIPIFGAVANVACMAFYVIGPIEGLGSAKEPLMAVGIAILWGLYGAFYFTRNSRKRGKSTILAEKPA